jgi:hypothetical protein
MKRTKENWISNQCFHQNNLSGLRAFHGEDLQFYERKKSMMIIQKQWLDNQIKEKELRKKRSQEEKMIYEMQEKELFRIRGIALDELEMKRKIMSQSTCEFNWKAGFEKRKEMEKRKKEIRDEELKDLKRQDEIRKRYHFSNPF